MMRFCFFHPVRSHRHSEDHGCSAAVAAASARNARMETDATREQRAGAVSSKHRALHLGDEGFRGSLTLNP